MKAQERIIVIKNGIELDFEAAEEGGYTVTVPDLPGCVSEGDTFEEALATSSLPSNTGKRSSRNSNAKVTSPYLQPSAPSQPLRLTGKHRSWAW